MCLILEIDIIFQFESKSIFFLFLFKATEFLSTFSTISNNTTLVDKQNRQHKESDTLTTNDKPIRANESQTMSLSNQKKAAPSDYNTIGSSGVSRAVGSIKKINTGNLLLSTEERLWQLLNENDKKLPMISLPDNDNYWSEGWKNNDAEHNNNNDLSIVSSSSSPVFIKLKFFFVLKE